VVMRLGGKVEVNKPDSGQGWRCYENSLLRGTHTSCKDE
jgi:hypothetical protein